MSDVAFLAGLNESTLSRLWDDPCWLDRISGKSLQALISTIPRVGEYVLGYALSDRRAHLAKNLTKHGVTVNRDAFKALVLDHGVAEQYLSNALNVALPIFEGDADQAAAYLFRFWGRDQDLALSYLIGTSDGPRLLLDPNPLIVAAVRIVDQLAARTNSFHAIVGQAALTHHLARVAGCPFSPDMSTINRQNALSFRSLAIGRIIATNDSDLAVHYCSSVAGNSFLSVIEEWSFPTYTHDARVTHDFSLPRSLVLRNTANEVLREIDTYNDAYLYYLAMTVVPTLLRRDPSFGARLPDLQKLLHNRLDSCGDPVARKACNNLLKATIECVTPANEESTFDHTW
ncbi:MAG: hypothetical protein ACRDRU_27400 [Pseudonocardiaceae bacterium]